MSLQGNRDGRFGTSELILFAVVVLLVEQAFSMVVDVQFRALLCVPSVIFDRASWLSHCFFKE